MSGAISALVVVRFFERHPPYNLGETAGFPYSEAKGLVDDGKAVFVTPPPGLTEDGQAETEGETETENDD